MLRIDPWPDEYTLEDFTKEQFANEAEEKCKRAGYDSKEILLLARGCLVEDEEFWKAWEDDLKLSRMHAAALLNDEKAWKMEYRDYTRNLD